MSNFKKEIIKMWELRSKRRLFPHFYFKDKICFTVSIPKDAFIKINKRYRKEKYVRIFGIKKLFSNNSMNIIIRQFDDSYNIFFMYFIGKNRHEELLHSVKIESLKKSYNFEFEFVNDKFVCRFNNSVKFVPVFSVNFFPKIILFPLIVNINNVGINKKLIFNIKWGYESMVNL